MPLDIPIFQRISWEYFLVTVRLPMSRLRGYSMHSMYPYMHTVYINGYYSGHDLKPRFKSKFMYCCPGDNGDKADLPRSSSSCSGASLLPLISIAQLLLFSLEFCFALLFRISQPLLALLQLQVPHLKLYGC